MNQAWAAASSPRDAGRGYRVAVVISPAVSATLYRAAVFAAAELTVAGINTTTLPSPSPVGDYDGIVWATPVSGVSTPPNTVTIHERGVTATNLAVSYSLSDVGRVAAEHLRGYRRHRLAVVRGTAPDSSESDIVRGFERCASASFVSDLSAWQRALAEGHRYDGVFAVSADTASAVLQTLRRRRIAVPGEVAVIGFDHAGLERIDAGLSLTTVDLPSRRMGSTAARMLIAALAGRRVGTTARILSPYITARKSAPRASRPTASPPSEALIS